MEAFKDAYEKNGKHFKKIHIHVTFSKEVQDKRFKTTTLHLPTSPSTHFTQYQTSIMVAGTGSKTGRKLFHAYCGYFEEYKHLIIGYKLEGLVYEPYLPPELEDFIYIEQHEKFANNENLSGLVSYNPKKQMYYTADRCYSRDVGTVLKYPFEVAFYEEQIVPFEKDWIEYSLHK